MSLELKKKVESLKAEVINSAKQVCGSQKTTLFSEDIDWSSEEDALLSIEYECAVYLVISHFLNNEYGGPYSIALSSYNKEQDLYVFSDITIDTVLFKLQSKYNMLNLVYDAQGISIFQSIDNVDYKNFPIINEAIFNKYKKYIEVSYQLQLLNNGESFDSYYHLGIDIEEKHLIEIDAIYSFKNNINNPELDYYQLKDKIEEDAESAGINHFELERLFRKYIVLSALKNNSILGKYQILVSSANKYNNKHFLSYGNLNTTLTRLVNDNILNVTRILYCDRMYKYFYELKNKDFRFSLEEKNYIEQYKKCTIMGMDLDIITDDVDESEFQSTLESEKEVLEYYKRTGLTSYNPYSTSYNNSISQASQVLSTPLYVPNQVVGATCPTCGKASVRKITTGKKATSFAFFGLFSSNLGKTMECSSCGYKW
ncbi:MAG: hypothetical protein IJF37_10705 [Lachnospiraceae bacterium]|nr:hypothetical protein [Lachnospiraceae bacterium]